MSNNLTEDFSTLIKTKILNGEFKIGTPLPSLRELSEQYGYSRTVVNTSVAKLATQGYIISKMRKMNVVNDYLNLGKIDVISDLVFSDNYDMSRKALNDIGDARKLIESESVRKACLNHSSIDFEEISLVISEEKKIGEINFNSINLASELDYQYHRSLVSLSDNIFYRLALNEFKEFSILVTKKYFYDFPESYSEIVNSHEALVISIKEKKLSEALRNLEIMLAGGDYRYKEKSKDEK